MSFADGFQIGSGIAPTGRKVILTGIAAIRLEDGREAELWATQDDLGWMHQLGMVSLPK